MRDLRSAIITENKRIFVKRVKRMLISKAYRQTGCQHVLIDLE